MPIINQNDAGVVEQRVRRVLDADSTVSQTYEIRGLFVELLDFERADGAVSLQTARANIELSDTAARGAARRVRNAEASEAVQLGSHRLDGSLLEESDDWCADS